MAATTAPVWPAPLPPVAGTHYSREWHATPNRQHMNRLGASSTTIAGASGLLTALSFAADAASLVPGARWSLVALGSFTLFAAAMTWKVRALRPTAHPVAGSAPRLRVGEAREEPEGSGDFMLEVHNDGGPAEVWATVASPGDLGLPVGAGVRWAGASTPSVTIGTGEMMRAHLARLELDTKTLSGRYHLLYVRDGVGGQHTTASWVVGNRRTPRPRPELMLSFSTTPSLPNGPLRVHIRLVEQGIQKLAA